MTLNTLIILMLIFFPMGMAPIVYSLGKNRELLTDRLAAVICGIELVFSLLLLYFTGELEISGIMSVGLGFRSDGIHCVYSLITSVLWFFTTVFGQEYFKHERYGIAAYWFFILLTLGAAQGVMLSSDIMTTYVFFEILSLTSFPWVLQERTPEAIRAACTYLAVAVIGGLILLMGLLMLVAETGTLEYSMLPQAVSGKNTVRVFAAGVCILLGFGAKAGMFPLHVWLPKAHPVAPAPASALLSGLLTKVGIYGILMSSMAIFAESRAFGLLVLVLGTITMVLGAVLAVFSVNLKRTLACSSMSQIGFILVGTASAILAGAFHAEAGIGLAMSGTVLHMVNHSLLKLVLFLAAGAVAMNLHTLSLTNIRGWGRNKPLLHIPFAIAALGISGVPMFNGYLSKSLLHEGLVHVAAEAGSVAWLLKGTEVLFLISGGLTFAYMLRLYICIFHERNRDPEIQKGYDQSTRCMKPLSAIVLLCGGAFLLLMSIPQFLPVIAERMTGLQFPHFIPFEAENLKGALISLSIGAAVYLIFIRKILIHNKIDQDVWPRYLDLEESVYRPILLKVLPGTMGRFARLFGENLVLKPLCRALVFAVSVFGRAMDTSLDAVILLSRKTILREDRVRDGEDSVRHVRFETLVQATNNTLSQISENFSYAMMMTCFGIILILGLLVSLML